MLRSCLAEPDRPGFAFHNASVPCGIAQLRYHRDQEERNPPNAKVYLKTILEGAQMIQIGGF
ncbi:hypothetical protein MED297_20002 [Reinekea sp. MED297]|uniref:Uncharacterized protein n=1 Tax=Reinekea blandensis MED297 TaxID=314283 RepID=A4B9A5_9GAMM|nr:hypothetical protein MED297_20002 [Reinekea sp. MED297] [Reinekea blandensis MED297]